ERNRLVGLALERSRQALSVRRQQPGWAEVAGLQPQLFYKLETSVNTHTRPFPSSVYTQPLLLEYGDWARRSTIILSRRSHQPAPTSGYEAANSPHATQYPVPLARSVFDYASAFRESKNLARLHKPCLPGRGRLGMSDYEASDKSLPTMVLKKKSLHRLSS